MPSLAPSSFVMHRFLEDGESETSLHYHESYIFLDPFTELSIIIVILQRISSLNDFVQTPRCPLLSRCLDPPSCTGTSDALLITATISLQYT